MLRCGPWTSAETGALIKHSAICAASGCQRIEIGTVDSDRLAIVAGTPGTCRDSRSPEACCGSARAEPQSHRPTAVGRYCPRRAIHRCRSGRSRVDGTPTGAAFTGNARRSRIARRATARTADRTTGNACSSLADAELAAGGAVRLTGAGELRVMALGTGGGWRTGLPGLVLFLFGFCPGGHELVEKTGNADGAHRA